MVHTRKVEHKDSKVRTIWGHLVHNPFNSELPFYYPTSVMLIDDDVDFLASYRSLLSLDHAVVAYSSVESAFKYIRNSLTPAHNTFNLFSKHNPHTDNDDGCIGDHLVVVKSSMLHDIALSPRRYRTPAVLIVDEMMPEARGLEICHLLQDTGIKTIMLSGAMTHDTAIDAFNGRKMDKFVSKSDPMALAKVQIAIHELQQEYFQDKLAAVGNAINVSKCDNLTVEQLIELMEAVYQEFPFIEYYYHSRSGGYLLRDENGVTKMLIFSDRIELYEMADLIAENMGENGITQTLKAGHKVVWDLFDDFEDGRPWDHRLEELVFPAKAMNEIRWSLVPDDQIPYQTDLSSSAWQSYRKQLMSYPINWTEAA